MKAKKGRDDMMNKKIEQRRRMCMFGVYSDYDMEKNVNSDCELLALYAMAYNESLID